MHLRNLVAQDVRRHAHQREHRAGRVPYAGSARQRRVPCADDHTQDPKEWLRLGKKIRELIGRVVPGCERYNERIRHPVGFVLHNAARERVFETSSGKARFTVQELPPESLAPGQLLMMTVRSHDQ